MITDRLFIQSGITHKDRLQRAYCIKIKKFNDTEYFEYLHNN